MAIRPISVKKGGLRQRRQRTLGGGLRVSFAGLYARTAASKNDKIREKEREMATDQSKQKPTIGWIGAGRMGTPMAERLIKTGYDVRIWNRTRAKAEPLAKIGGTLVDRL